jgi:hypothetical protein
MCLNSNEVRRVDVIAKYFDNKVKDIVNSVKCEESVFFYVKP